MEDKSYIVSFFHCKECLQEVPEGVSPADYADLEVGFTILGLQVYCNRHKKNVVHLDFEGRKFNALSSKIPKIHEATDKINSL